MRLRFLTVALVSALPGISLANTLSLGVAAGDVRQNAAVLWAAADTDGPLTFELASDAGFTHLLGSASLTASAGMPAKLVVSGLTPGATYHYRATDTAGNSAAGRFRTPHAGGYNGLRFGVSGDWRGQLAPYPAVKNVPARNLDVFVKLGDTIYAENYDVLPVVTVDTLDGYRDRYRVTLRDNLGQTNQIHQLRQATAVLASIDDHEVVNDFAGGAPSGTDPRFPSGYAYINETPHFRDGLQAFHEFMPIRDLAYDVPGDPRLHGKVKLYRTVTYGRRRPVPARQPLLPRRRSARCEQPARPRPGRQLPHPVAVLPPHPAGRGPTGRAQGGLLRAQQDGVTWKVVSCVRQVV